MDNEHTQLIVIGSAEGQCTLIDPLTGMIIAPTDAPNDPFAHFQERRERFALATRLLEFAHGHYPREPMSRQVLDSAQIYLDWTPEGAKLLASLKQCYANLAMTAAWLGAKVGDPSAGTCMAAQAVARRDPDVLQRTYGAVALMVYLAERKGDVSVRSEFDELVWQMTEGDPELD